MIRKIKAVTNIDKQTPDQVAAETTVRVSSIKDKKNQTVSNSSIW